jgi:hypothetical protein
VYAPNSNLNLYSATENSFVPPHTPTFAQSASSSPSNFVHAANSPPLNFAQSANSPSFTFVHLSSSPQINEFHAPQQTYNISQMPATNSVPPRMDNYDRAFFDWLDEQIFESSNACHYSPHSQQPNSVQSRQIFSSSFGNESALGSQYSNSSVPQNQFEHQMYNFDQMNRAVGSNSMHKVGSGKYIVLNVKNC